MHTSCAGLTPPQEMSAGRFQSQPFANVANTVLRQLKWTKFNVLWLWNGTILQLHGTGVPDAVSVVELDKLIIDGRCWWDEVGRSGN